MIIHTVESGDTIYSISKQYGITSTRIITDNFLNPEKKLVPGQTLIISRPCKTCTVMGGDTLESIAKEHNISVLSILQNNPQIADKKILPSQTLNISYNTENSRQIVTAAYSGGATFETIEKYLPNISMLVVQNVANISKNGILVTKSAKHIAALAKKYRTMPILAIECINERGKHDNSCIESLLNSSVDTEAFISSIISTAKDNGFCGIEINSSGINASNKYRFADMLLALSGLCRDNGLYCQSSILPIEAVGKAEENIMDISDIIPLWSYIFDDNSKKYPAAPLNKIVNFLNSKNVEKFNDKIMLGIPTFGIEYLKSSYGERKRVINSSDGIILSQKPASITEFDEVTHTPLIKYTDGIRRDNISHTVHYEDARSISEKLDVVDEYNLYGVNIMSLEYENPVLWQILNQRYNILKF